MNLQKIKNKQMKIFMSKAARPNEKQEKENVIRIPPNTFITPCSFN